MTATILDGRALSNTLREELDQAVAIFKEKHGVTPTIAVVRAGEDPASVSYAGAIQKTFDKRGMGFQLHTLPESASQDEIVALVTRLNADKEVHGIMIQEPLPRGIDEAAVKEALSPDKDVDGVHPVNTGRLAQVAPAGRPPMVGPFFVPATPAGGMEILKRYNVAISGKHAVVVGRSNIVGKPMALLLLRENATVTVCHSRTADLAAVCRTADILCAAVGQAKMIKGDWIKPGAVVIDFGVNFVEGQMCGDVDFDEAVEVAGMITPVPGGTGPMTNMMLALNVLEAARRIMG
ncbi:MAG: bifunctional 5,10-methylenetetrahydrofolate dehydrogenase/5,10-methenyltetrahydrofolate cyclohydrolase [Anaerolineae bacterium]|jgi:methylenetetrahydrofolate dehydrogenase (NADP+)/methenyltetrahydrofolate cyclohydrolase|nr:bifunctional 5,10-methylenetetrahydrofolate dehydrogenase/5,10-methenyltetrahydrofolate cyclohydrolase [Anaerolineae bacterium]MDH7473183.1 bifunctional 5,10-methylenetetrahydrofolate dehydrogenase/5,10-methenyltetrahydrofolate cyclohydrolase [Anaerolineae bacterium]